LPSFGPKFGRLAERPVSGKNGEANVSWITFFALARAERPFGSGRRRARFRRGPGAAGRVCLAADSVV
jgi:hypothetical protein